MKKPNISIGELLALWDQFSPERAQNTRLAQAGQAINLAQGVQQLQDMPADSAARRASNEAQLQAINFQTEAGRSMLPGQIASQAAQLAATQAGTEATQFQTAESRAMAPILRENATLDTTLKRGEVANQPTKIANENKAVAAQIAALLANADQSKMQGLSQGVPAIQMLLTELKGLQPPGAASPITSEISGELLAQLMEVPAIADAMKKAGLVREKLNTQQQNYKARDFKSTANRVLSNPLMTPMPTF